MSCFKQIVRVLKEINESNFNGQRCKTDKNATIFRLQK